MGVSGLRTPGLAALAILATAPWQANAQCRLCDKPVTVRSEAAADGDIQLQIESSINFDRLILFGTGEGSAVLRPDGSKAANGTIGDIGPRAMVGTAKVHGSPGRVVRIDLPRQIDLYSLSGGRLRFDEVISDLPALPRLDSAGNLSFRFGGRVRISGDADGAYRGDLPITVEYQ
ncbi:MAG: DUF4402 domain-containing protein [Sphingomicrobium sp.]